MSRHPDETATLDERVTQLCAKIMRIAGGRGSPEHYRRAVRSALSLAMRAASDPGLPGLDRPGGRTRRQRAQCRSHTGSGERRCR